MKLPFRPALLLPVLALSLATLGCQSEVQPLAPSHPVGTFTVSQLDGRGSPSILRFARVHDAAHAARQIYRGGDPDEEDLDDLARLGIKTFVSLQSDGDPDVSPGEIARERAVVTRLGMAFWHLPVPDGEVPSAWTVQRWLVAARASARSPVFIHCEWGRDRTGAMIAAYRILENGYTPDQALREMAQFGYEAAWYPDLADFVRRLGAQRARN